MPNFSIPLSGLDANSAALATTANNLANLNTIGYKDQQIQFADLFYQNLGTDGAGDPIQQGAGVQVSSPTHRPYAGGRHFYRRRYRCRHQRQRLLHNPGKRRR